MNVNPGKVSKGMYMSLVLAMALGCYFRLRNIEVRGLWLDEAFSVATSDRVNSFIDVCRNTLSDVHPAFYQVALWLFYHVFGFGEFAGRYLSVVFGVLLIPSVFFLGRRLFDERVGTIVAWLTSINYFLICYSQETRSYSLLVLLTVLSFLLFLRCMYRARPIDFVCYSIVVFMLVNTHYFGFLSVMAQAVFFLIAAARSENYKSQLYKFCGCAIFVVLTLVPSFSYIKGSFAREDIWIDAPHEDFFSQVFSLYFGNDFLTYLLLSLFVVGSGFLMVSDRVKASWRLLMIWCVIGVVVPYICSIYIRPVLSARNLIILLPMILLVIAFAISMFKDDVVKVLMVVVIVCFSLTPLLTDISKVSNPKYRVFEDKRFREMVTYLMGESLALPMYSNDSIQMNVYFKLLNSSLKVENVTQLEADLVSSKRPTAFYFLDTNYGPGLGKDFLEKYRLETVGKKELGGSMIRQVRALP